MRQAFCLSDVHQVSIGKPGLFEDGTGYLNIVVLGERADHAGRRVRHGRDPPRKLGKRLSLDLLDQTTHHVVKQGNMIRVEAGCAVEEQSGYAA